MGKIVKIYYQVRQVRRHRGSGWLIVYLLMKGLGKFLSKRR